MKLSDLIVKFFEEKEVKHIFGYIGGAITHLVDSIDKNKNVDFIQTYHEQTASISAEGYSRETGNIGVAIATSGPGATNLITGIADAYFDSIPTIYITGQVNTYEYKYDKPIRQQGFQEMDVVNVVKSITKYAKLIDNSEEILYELEKAYSIAKSGRPGPVLLDIPMNIQRAEVDEKKLRKYIEKEQELLEVKINDNIKEVIQSSKSPLILVGGGMRNLTPKTKQEFEEFLYTTQIPVICSLMGKGIFSEERINFVGMVGSYGNRCANMSIANSDLLIALGSRLDTRQTGAKYEDFLKKGKIIQVDIDKNELELHRINNKFNLNMNAETFIKSFITLKIKDIEKWSDYISGLINEYGQEKEINRFISNKSPYRLIQKLNEVSQSDDSFVADIGQNQMWTAQTLKIKKDQTFFTSGGLAPMGFSMPFAIGLAFANKKKRIFSINGDGGFHMSTQGLMLISQHNLPIKTIVINNGALGMITQFQGLYFNNNMVGTTEKGGYIVPKIEDLSKAYSLKYYKIREQDLLNEELMKRIFDNRTPCVIEYMTDGLTTVSPKVEYDSPIWNPSPKLEKEELERVLKLRERKC